MQTLGTNPETVFSGTECTHQAFLELYGCWGKSGWGLFILDNEHPYYFGTALQCFNMQGLASDK